MDGSSDWFIHLVMWLLCEKPEFANCVVSVPTRTDLGCVWNACVLISLLFVRLGCLKRVTDLYRILNNKKHKTAHMAASCDSRSDGCLRRRKASRASCAAWEGETRRRSARGRKNSEDRLVCRGTVTLDLTPLPQARALGALTWETRRLTERLLYISDYVCNSTAEDRQWSTTDLFFSRISWRAEIQWFLSSFLSFFRFSIFCLFLLPKHCDCACERLHPILYLCNVEPCSACRGLPGAGGGSSSSPIKPALVLLETSAFTRWTFYQNLPVSGSESSRMLF